MLLPSPSLASLPHLPTAGQGTEPHSPCPTPRREALNGCSLQGTPHATHPQILLTHALLLFLV